VTSDAEYHSSQSGQQGAFEASGGYVTSETDRVMGLIGPFHNLLSTIDARDAAFQVHRLSPCHRLDNLAQVADPLLDGAREAFAEVDRTLRCAEVHLIGVDPYDQAA